MEPLYATRLSYTRPLDIAQQLIHVLPLPAQLWDAQGRLVAFNQAYARLLGFTRTDGGPEQVPSLLNDGQIATSGLATRMADVLHGQSVEIASFDYDPAKNGAAPPQSGLKRIAISLQPLMDGGRLQGVLCLITDYGELSNRGERDLMRSQKMENVEALASAVAHEFNNIFTGIRGLSGLVRDSVDAQSEVYGFTLEIDKNIRRGADLISKLSSFAREMPHSLRMVRLGDYTRHALELVSLQAQRRIELQTDLQAEGDVLIDTNRLDQALANIVNNAKDAMAGKGSLRLASRLECPPEHLLSTGADRQWALIEIADSGPGIAAEAEARVLEPFFSTKDRGKATGLGLSVTHRIVEMHGGVLEVGRSLELGGAAIRIFIPLVQASAAMEET